MLTCWLFVLHARLRAGIRIECGVELKGLRNIRLGARCKLHRFATVDAARGHIVLGNNCTVFRPF